MVRPRASIHNLGVAVAFSEIITVRMDSSDVYDSRKFLEVPCNGSRTVFAAFALCIPDLARDSSDKHPHNRQGITAVELNKAMQVKENIAPSAEYDRNNGLLLGRWIPPDPTQGARLPAHPLRAPGQARKCKRTGTDEASTRQPIRPLSGR